MNAGVGGLRLCSNGRSCPGYGDAYADVYCCPSIVNPGDFYCCDLLTKQRSEAHGLWKEYVDVVFCHYDKLENSVMIFSRVGEIIGAFIGAFAVFVVLVVLCCSYCHCCYLYKLKQKRIRNHAGPNFHCGPTAIGFSRNLYVDRTQLDNSCSSLPYFHGSTWDHKSQFFGAPPPPYTVANQYTWSSSRMSTSPAFPVS
ncbi:unnamed protein product [Soboliphyme baturini]|uniref:Protein shisa-5-like n=1 Tax=Soboliphyme baturini TaxID=241478 RepID=A0A183IGE2_9BILA|nr:unnamed protein product [Soboliphyme baturini]